MFIIAITDTARLVLPAAISMFCLGLGFALVLLAASIKLKVDVDPRIEQVRQVLPGADCGACGLAGCNSYAKAVVDDVSLLGKCAPGGMECSEKIAKILNLQLSESGPAKKAVVFCNAHTEDKTFYAAYTGIESCTAANAAAVVQACKFGCLGYGDCVKVCKFDAIKIISGLAVIDYNKCTGCGACAEACPRFIIKMEPFVSDDTAVVACSSQENGKTTRKMCKVGCIGCKMCTKLSELFEMNGNHAVAKTAQYKPDDQTVLNAISKCPTKVIVMRGKNSG